MRWTARVKDEVGARLDGACDQFKKSRGDLLEELDHLGYVNVVRSLWATQRDAAERIREEAANPPDSATPSPDAR